MSHDIGKLNLKDKYTGKNMEQNEKANLDHVIASKELYENELRKQRINTAFGRKLSEIKKEIKAAHNDLQKAKDKYIFKKTEYDIMPKYKFIKRSKLKKEYQSAMDDLTIANSEALAKNFRIIRLTLELVVACFFIPMDFIRSLHQWCVASFEKRDKLYGEMMDIMIDAAENDETQGMDNYEE